MQARPKPPVHRVAELDHQRLFRLVDDEDALGTDQNQNDDQADQKGKTLFHQLSPLGLLRVASGSRPPERCSWGAIFPADGAGCMSGKSGSGSAIVYQQANTFSDNSMKLHFGRGG